MKYIRKKSLKNIYFLFGPKKGGEIFLCECPFNISTKDPSCIGNAISEYDGVILVKIEHTSPESGAQKIALFSSTPIDGGVKPNKLNYGQHELPPDQIWVL